MIFLFYQLYIFLTEIVVTCCEFLYGSTNNFSFASVLYRSEKSSQILKRKTGNLKENKSTENGVVEVGEVELEAVCCPSDDCREVNEDLKRNKNLNEDNSLEGDTKLDEENASEGGIPNQENMMHQMVGISNKLKIKVRVIKNITNSKMSKKKKLFAVKKFWVKCGWKKGNTLTKKQFV